LKIGDGETADGAHLEVPIHLVVDGEVLALLLHELEILAIAPRDAVVVDFHSHLRYFPMFMFGFMSSLLRTTQG
jgi:hypothetical protein